MMSLCLWWKVCLYVTGKQACPAAWQRRSVCKEEWSLFLFYLLFNLVTYYFSSVFLIKLHVNLKNLKVLYILLLLDKSITVVLMNLQVCMTAENVKWYCCMVYIYLSLLLFNLLVPEHSHCHFLVQKVQLSAFAHCMQILKYNWQIWQSFSRILMQSVKNCCIVVHKRILFKMCNTLISIWFSPLLELCNNLLLLPM